MQCIKKFTYAELTASFLCIKQNLYFTSLYVFHMFFICAQVKLKTGSNISRFYAHIL